MIIKDSIALSIIFWIIIAISTTMCILFILEDFFNINIFNKKSNYDTKYDKKIDKAKTKILDLEDKIETYKEKKIYKENIKILHEKSLKDNVQIISTDYLKYLQNCEQKLKRKKNKNDN